MIELANRPDVNFLCCSKAVVQYFYMRLPLGWGRRHSFEFCINEKNKNQKEPFALGKSGKLRAMNLKGDGFYLSISTVLFTN
ncbi:MAG: hypothetical protein H6573_20755 [Lewinellaceae bacterium]|nr:hypothetical protein [Lewinellaceae bacterium]